MVAPEKKPKANWQIRSPRLRVIDENGEQLGVLETPRAIQVAQERGLDLVEINPQLDPPLAKIIDYGKYLYQKERSRRGGKGKKSPIQEVKIVRIGFKTSNHDLQIKSRLADKFLAKGHRVRLEIFLRGRERTFKDMARQKLESFREYLSLIYAVEENIRPFPSGFSMLIKPGKTKK